MSGSKDKEETPRWKHLTCRGTEGRGGDVPSESAPRGPLQAGHAFGFLEQEALGRLLAGTAAADAVAGCSGPHGQAAKAEQQVRAVFTVAVARHPVGRAISAPLFLDAFQESFGNCTPAEPGSTQPATWNLGHLSNMPGTICSFSVFSLFRIYF